MIMMMRYVFLSSACTAICTNSQKETHSAIQGNPQHGDDDFKIDIKRNVSFIMFLNKKSN